MGYQFFLNVQHQDMNLHETPTSQSLQNKDIIAWTLCGNDQLELVNISSLGNSYIKSNPQAPLALKRSAIKVFS